MRISRDLMWMMMAEAAARRSTCRRLNVGAILIYDNDVVSVGYNGPPSGEPHCYGGDCGIPSCTRSIHAEHNAIVRACEKGFEYFDAATLYTTNSPCEKCFNVIQAYHIKRVVFKDEYRISQHLKADHGIQVEKITPSGYLTDFVTGRLVEGPEGSQEDNGGGHLSLGKRKNRSTDPEDAGGSGVCCR